MYSRETIAKIKSQLIQKTKEKRQKIRNGEKLKLVVSKGNSKIGKSLNVSNAPIITCSNCSECKYYCYDVKACLQYPNVLEARTTNTALLLENMNDYFLQLWQVMERRKKNFTLRFHVSGDITTEKHLHYIILTATRFPHYKIWTYTKNYHIVNKYVNENGKNAIPGNLSIMFSEWQGLPMSNPHNMPVFACKMPENSPERFETMYKCPGNCDICKELNRGCINRESAYTDLH